MLKLLSVCEGCLRPWAQPLQSARFSRDNLPFQAGSASGHEILPVKYIHSPESLDLFFFCQSIARPNLGDINSEKVEINANCEQTTGIGGPHTAQSG